MAERECFIAEGRLAVEALLDSGSFELENVQIEEGRHGGLLERLEAEGVPFQLRSRRELQVEAGYDFHRGVFARVKRPCSAEPSGDDLQRTARLVFPVGLADPGNLGTVVRNGVAFGADGIVLERDRGADIWSRKSIRASATGVFRIPIYRPRGIVDFLIRARDSG
ncbi:MAG: TrmH family RNA methyltransferase, partial [Verrucomicrobiota bacterium]